MPWFINIKKWKWYIINNKSVITIKKWLININKWFINIDEYLLINNLLILINYLLILINALFVHFGLPYISTFLSHVTVDFATQAWLSLNYVHYYWVAVDACITIFVYRISYSFSWRKYGKYHWVHTTVIGGSTSMPGRLYSLYGESKRRHMTMRICVFIPPVT